MIPCQPKNKGRVVSNLVSLINLFVVANNTISNIELWFLNTVDVRSVIAAAESAVFSSVSAALPRRALPTPSIASSSRLI